MSEGPMFKQVVAAKMARDAVPPGGGVLDGVNFLLNGPRVRRAAREAAEWVRQAIRIVKSANDNPYGDDDEAICRAILDELKKQQKEKTDA